MHMRHAALALFLTFPVLAQPPSFRGGTIATAHATGDLGRQIANIGSGGDRVWVGYSIPLLRRHHVEVCCNSIDCGVCPLDGEHWSTTIRTDSDAFVDRAAIFFRVRNGAIDSVRAFTGCAIDTSDQKVTWLEDVDPRASVSLLAKLINDDREISKKAVFALSLHEGSTDALIDIAKHHPSSSIRGNALFWLAQTAVVKAEGALRDAVDNDPDDEVRGKAVFAISQLPNDQSIPLLVDLMRTHKSRAVRKKAAFWLGQKNDPRALDAIENFLRQ